MEDQSALKKIQKRLAKRSFIEDKYKQEKEIEDPRFGKITIWSKNGEKNLILMVKRVTNSVDGCLKDVQVAKERIKFNHGYLMKLVDFSVKILDLDHFEVWGFYEAPLHDLSKEIENRKKKKK